MSPALAMPWTHEVPVLRLSKEDRHFLSGIWTLPLTGSGVLECGKIEMRQVVAEEKVGPTCQNDTSSFPSSLLVLTLHKGNKLCTYQYVSGS